MNTLKSFTPQSQDVSFTFFYICLWRNVSLIWNRRYKSIFISFLVPICLFREFQNQIKRINDTLFIWMFTPVRKIPSVNFSHGTATFFSFVYISSIKICLHVCLSPPPCWGAVIDPPPWYSACSRGKMTWELLHFEAKTKLMPEKFSPKKHTCKTFCTYLSSRIFCMHSYFLY